MSLRILVVAPHPDDETLGCGGTLLTLASQGAKTGWLIVTDLTERYSEAQKRERASVIEQVAGDYGFEHTYALGLPTARLDTLPKGDIVEAVGQAITDFRPDWLLVPHRGDVHSDHRIVFDACAACSKWFRYPFVRRVMSYETPSETDQGLDPSMTFRPNVFFDISHHLQSKLDIMSRYESECEDFPFPRSTTAIESLARLRGSQAGYAAAEAFMLLRERHG